MLALPRPDLPVIIDTDARYYQFGGALFHIYTDGESKPIGFESWTTNQNKKNYSVAQNECLAVV